MYNDKPTFSGMEVYEDKPPIEYLMHYGMPRRSGRYPWGSGKDPYQHESGDFLSRVEDMKKQGFKETAEDIKKYFGEKMTLDEYRQEKTWANYQRKMDMLDRIKSLQEDGLNTSEIGRRLGVNESTIRGMLDEDFQNNLQEAEKCAEFLYDKLQEKGMIDVGPGVEQELNISRTKLDNALWILEKKAGCPVYSGRINQPTNAGQSTTQTVLCLPGTEHKEIYNLENVHSVGEYYSNDGGQTFNKFRYPASLDSSRLMIRYKEDGGIDRDGIIELRRNVPDLSLGNDRYSQVRILVDGNKYLKGMAVYSDDMPDGVDVIFNTNKTKDKSKMEVLKDIKNDPDNPFGSLIKANGQSEYIDPKTGEKKLSLINKRASEGDWTEWQDALPSQFLAKQNITLAQKQLDLAKADKLAEYEEICSINNPTVKKYYLQKFADECDAAAVNLKAAALPRQKYHVIIPINTLKDTEVYAPQYKDGEKLALIRYPHGGTFEIPILTVNNKNKEGDNWIGKTSIDAIGITKKVADRLSGADFDGDTVMCIPTGDKKGKVKITSTKYLEGLEGFDPKTEYPYREGMKVMKDTQKQMGVISNLITDMTLAGATSNELERAVKHSMVVIDAEKHKLDYKRSEKENNIAELKEKYQRSIQPDGSVKIGGASTLLSRSKSEYSVLKRQGTPKINTKYKKNGELNPDYDPDRPEGALIYKTASDVAYTKYKKNKRTGEITTSTEYRTQKSTRMAETDDAFTLLSDARHPMEVIYAKYANSMKSLANDARKEYVSTGDLKYSAEANKKYAKEVSSLNMKLNNALLNAPREREALRRANVEVKNKESLDPKMKKADKKKIRQQAVSKARADVGSIKRRDRNIIISDKEWEAIQAGAISNEKLKKILNNSDPDSLRQRATPKASNVISTAKMNRVKAMANSNYTAGEIAEKLNISTSSVYDILKGEK